MIGIAVKLQYASELAAEVTDETDEQTPAWMQRRSRTGCESPLADGLRNPLGQLRGALLFIERGLDGARKLGQQIDVL